MIALVVLLAAGAAAAVASYDWLTGRSGEAWMAGAIAVVCLMAALALRPIARASKGRTTLHAAVKRGSGSVVLMEVSTRLLAAIDARTLYDESGHEITVATTFHEGVARAELAFTYRPTSVLQRLRWALFPRR